MQRDPRFDRPDLQMNFFLWAIEKRDARGVYPHKWPGFSLSPVHLRPEGRGRVSLGCPDPLARRASSFEYLVDRLRRRSHALWHAPARKIAAQPSLRPYVAEEVSPGPTMTSDEALVEDLRRRGVSNLAPGRHVAAWGLVQTRPSIRGCACTA